MLWHNHCQERGNNFNMQKLNLSIILILLNLGPVMAQGFVEPFTDYFSERECYVITNSGDRIVGWLRSANETNGFITRLSLKDVDGQVHKFKAGDIQGFSVKPDLVSKLSALSESSNSIREIMDTDHEEIMSRGWIHYDAQVMPRRKKKMALLQLLNPTFDEHIKVYYHLNGSKSMPISVGGINLVGGEERTYWVVKGNSKPLIVRKASFKKYYNALFADEPEMLKLLAGKPDFDAFAQYIQTYNGLKSK